MHRFNERSYWVANYQRVALLMAAVLGLQSAGAVANSQADGSSPKAWKAGYAEAEITPRPGEPVMLAGFGIPRIAEQIESPLRAQALAVQDAAGNRMILITADVLGFGRTTVDAVRHKLQRKHQMGPASICFAASHTHGGPAVNERTSGSIGDANVWYLAFLETTLLQVAESALDDLAPADIACGTCEVHIGMSRRLPGENGEINWAPNPAGSYDGQTPIVHVRRQQSPQQLVLVGHACHPTSMGEMNQWSPDYPGAMRRKIESELDDSRALFVMGCGADAKVVYQAKDGKHHFAARPELSHRAGYTLADAVLQRIADSPLAPLSGELQAVLVQGSLSLQPGKSREYLEDSAWNGNLKSYVTWWARKQLAFPDNRRTFDYEVQACRLGELTVVALAGEVCADWGPLTRSLTNTPHAMVIGYANEVSAYIPTARIIREGGYEGDASHKVYLLPAPFEPQSEVELTSLIRRAVAALDGDKSVTALGNSEGKNPRTLDDGTSEEPQPNCEPWEMRRRGLVSKVEEATGPLPGRHFRVPLELKIVDETDCGTYVRKKITYQVDPYDRVESYLLVPRNLRGPAAAIVALHGTNRYGKDPVVGLVEKFPPEERAKMGRRAYGHELAERGYVVIAPDYWYYGAYDSRRQTYSPYQRGYASATMKGVWNHMRAIDVLETLPEVNPNRIGAIGQSLGGYNTLFLGTFDSRVQVMVSSAGYNAFADYAASPYGKGNLDNWGIDKHIRRIRTVYDNDPARVPFDFPELLSALAPRPVFTNAPLHDEYFAVEGVRKCLDAARPVYRQFDRADALEAHFPDAGHDFPDEQRRAAYEFFDKHLRRPADGHGGAKNALNPE